MKKILIVAAAAGLMSVAACTPAATNNTVDANDVEANAAPYDAAAANEVDANAVAPDAVVANEGEVANTN